MVDFQTLFSYLTLISLTIGVIYHIMTLRNTRRNQELTLETRQAQMFLGIVNQMNRADFRDAWREVMPVEWGTLDEALKAYNDPELGRHLTVLGWFFEPLGVRARAIEIKGITTSIIFSSLHP
jgi:hypothetical protein